MTKILVTGAFGFIGSHLVPELRRTGYEVIELDIESGDVSDESTWLKFPLAEAVIHLAGKSFVPDSWSAPGIVIKHNLMGTICALNYCKNHDARLVFLSSYLYGDPGVLPIPETAPLSPSNPYALSKKLAEEACQFYAENFGVTTTILRPFNVYGPGQPANFLIPSIIRQVLAGDVIKVNDLEPKRDYIYIDDLVQAISKALHFNGKFEVFNIGSGVSHSVAELIKLVQGLKKTNYPLRSQAERRKGEIMDTVADITKAKRKLDWVPRWTLLEGLEEMLNKNSPNE